MFFVFDEIIISMSSTILYGTVMSTEVQNNAVPVNGNIPAWWMILDR